MTATLIMPVEKWQFARDTYALAQGDLNDCDQNSTEELRFYGRAEDRALKEMMQAPAPDAAALVYKLETFRDENCAQLRYSLVHFMLNAMIADARALAGGQMA